MTHHENGMHPAVVFMLSLASGKVMKVSVDGNKVHATNKVYMVSLWILLTQCIYRYQTGFNEEMFQKKEHYSTEKANPRLPGTEEADTSTMC